MTAEEYVQAHGDTFVKWLQDNTVECACEDKYGCDESKRHCETIDAAAAAAVAFLGPRVKNYGPRDGSIAR